MALGAELKRLGKHSAIYGLGGLVSRILAVLLLPLYTRYLSPSDYGVVETLIALTTVVGIALSAGIGSAFFRFYFDSNEPAARRRVLRTSFWFIMAMATLGLVVGVAFAGELSQFLFGTTKDCEARRRLIRRSLGWDELGAAHQPLPRRGTLGRLRVGERREHPRHGRSDADSRRRARQGPDRRHRRELHGNARRLLRARVLPP